MADIVEQHKQILAKGTNPNNNAESYSGPFDTILPYDGTATYPALWNNSGITQTCMKLQPDKKLIPLNDVAGTHIDSVWEKTRSCIHINLELRSTSQRLAFAYTDDPTIGGSAWASISMHDQYEKYEKSMVVWGNTTLGILCRWYVSSKQQLGRLRLGVNTAKDMSVLDFTMLKDDQISELEKYLTISATSRLTA